MFKFLQIVICDYAIYYLATNVPELFHFYK